MPRRPAHSSDPLTERAALVSSAREILREAEHHLRSLDAQFLRSAQNLADARELVAFANASLAEASAASDASGRADALHDLAAATDVLRRAEQLAAELADFKNRALRHRDRAAQHLRDAENPFDESPHATPAS